MESFKNSVRRLGVFFDTIEMNGRPAVFIHFGDTTKKQQKVITGFAKENSLKIDIADKGAIFSAR